MQNQEKQIIDLSKVKFLVELAKTHQNSVIINLVQYGKDIIVQKSILQQSLITQKQVEHLYNERQALQELNFPSINKFIGTSKDLEWIYLFIHFEKGISLHRLLMNIGKISIKFADFFLIQLLFTFQYLHNNGWIYRDLKATNVIITQEFRIKLIDFGFAKKIQKQRTSTFCGTIHSMPPEVIINNNYQYDYSFDIYTLGIIYYEMLIGKPPFGLNEDNIKTKIIAGINKDLLENIKNIDQRNLIEIMLNINPNERPKIDDLLKNQYLAKYNQNLIYDFIFGKDQNEFQSGLYDEEIYLYCTQFNFEDENEDEIQDSLQIF